METQFESETALLESMLTYSQCARNQLEATVGYVVQTAREYCSTPGSFRRAVISAVDTSAALPPISYPVAKELPNGLPGVVVGSPLRLSKVRGVLLVFGSSELLSDPTIRDYTERERAVVVLIAEGSDATGVDVRVWCAGRLQEAKSNWRIRDLTGTGDLSRAEVDLLGVSTYPWK